MGEVISYVERPAHARGLQKAALPKDDKVREYLFAHEYQYLHLLKAFPASISYSRPLLLYPGCGADILFPLHYAEKMNRVEISFLFIDVDDNLGVLKTVLDDVGIAFAEETDNQTNNKSIHFYWKGILVHLEFRLGDIFTLLPTLPAFDIYFERAFGIMKEGHAEYERQVYAKLKPGGLLISDSGFYKPVLQKIDIPSELSSYGEMIAGIKPIKS